MKKNKYIILICFIILFSNESRGQFAIAGIPGLWYFDVSPDSLLDPPYNLGAYFDEFDIDINQDGGKDLKIKSYVAVSSGGNARHIIVSSLNSSITFYWGKTDSTNAGTHIRDMLKMYDVGDTISTGKFINSGYLTYSSTSGGSTTISPDWIGAGDKFFGVKYQDSVNTYFGWVKVNVSGYKTCLVEAYSLEEDIESIQKQNVSFIESNVYPNPSINQLFIETEIYPNLFVKIYDITGRLVFINRLQNNNTSIDVSSFNPGIYIAEKRVKLIKE